MAKIIVKTDKAPAPGGQYSQAVRVGNDVYVSGSGPFDPKTHALVAGGIEEQTRQTLENISAILQAAGSCLDDVVKVTVFLKDMNDFNAMNKAYSEYFAENPPARTTVQAELFGKGRLIVMDAVACIS